VEVIKGDIYDYPRYYDLVFGSDWRAETRFLQACFELHVTGPTKNLFEPACGTGRLIYRLASAGFTVRGLDLNEKSVAYCNQRFEKHSMPAPAWVADMTDFTLAPQADAAFNTISSFRHLGSEAEALAHLQCMAEAIRPGGIYALGLHLSPTERDPSEEEAWSASSGHLTVNTHMYLLERNWEKRNEVFEMNFDVYTPTRSFRLQDRIAFRTYTSTQMFDLLGQVPEWEHVATYDFGYHMNEPIEIDDTTEDAVLILRRR